MSDEHPDGWRLGDRVEVESLWASRPRRNYSGRRATGRIAAIHSHGIVVEFDCGTINGKNFCTASPRELTRIGDFPQQI